MMWCEGFASIIRIGGLSADPWVDVRPLPFG